MVFSSKLVLLLGVVCYAYGKSVSEDAEETSKSVAARADPDVNVVDFNDYPFMAAIQRSPGHCSKSANAVFIGESWVLTCTSLIQEFTSTKNLKKIVVVHGSTSPFDDGDTYRVKQIYPHAASGLSVLRVSNEIQTICPMVPKDFEIGSCDALSMLRWDCYGEELLLTENINIDATAVVPPDFFAIPEIPLTGKMDKCAVLLNDDKQLVGMVETTSGVSGDPIEKVIAIAAYSRDFQSIMNYHG